MATLDRNALTVAGKTAAAEVFITLPPSGTMYLSFVTGDNLVAILPSSFSIEVTSLKMDLYEGGSSSGGAVKTLRNLRVDASFPNAITLGDSILIGNGIDITGTLVFPKNVIGDAAKTVVVNTFDVLILRANTHYYFSFENQENKAGPFNMTLKLANLGN